MKSFLATLLAAAAAGKVQEVGKGHDETYNTAKLDETVLITYGPIDFKVQAETSGADKVNSKAVVTLADKDYVFTSAYTYSEEGAQSFKVTGTYGDCTHTWVFGDSGSWFDCPSVEGFDDVRISVTQRFDSSVNSWVQPVGDGWRMWFSIQDKVHKPLDYATYVDMTTLMWAETLYEGPGAGKKVAVLRWNLDQTPWRKFSNNYDPELEKQLFQDSKSIRSFPRMATLMATRYPEFSWEPITVPAGPIDATYELTMFHVWKTDCNNESLGPVFFQHGGTQDGASWLYDTGYEGGLATQIQMASKGYDVYIGNQRGTEYSSWGSLASTPAAYWDFNLEQYADDLLANMQAMYSDSGKKGWYFGYSLGSMQMLIGLSKYEEELKWYLNRATLLAPCTLLGDAAITIPGFESLLTPNRLQDEAAQLGVYAMNGPAWDSVAICKDGAADFCGLASLVPPAEPVGIQVWMHQIQNALAGRFQPYMKEWTLETATEGVPYDLEGIDSVPITLIVGQEDTTCPASYADDLAKRLSTLQKHIEIKDAGHEFFQFGNHPQYIDMLVAEITAEVPAVATAVVKEIVEMEKIDDSGSDALLGAATTAAGDGAKVGDGAMTLAPFVALLITASQLILQ